MRLLDVPEDYYIHPGSLETASVTVLGLGLLLIALPTCVWAVNRERTIIKTTFMIEHNLTFWKFTKLEFSDKIPNSPVILHDLGVLDHLLDGSKWISSFIASVLRIFQNYELNTVNLRLTLMFLIIVSLLWCPC